MIYFLWDCQQRAIKLGKLLPAKWSTKQQGRPFCFKLASVPCAALNSSALVWQGRQWIANTTVHANLTFQCM